MSSFEQVFNAGGPDPGRLTSAAQLTELGTMLARQRPILTISGHVFKLSSQGAAPMRAQAVLSKGISWWLPNHTFARPVPAGDSGLTIGSGNSAVRVIAKAGWSVRFGIVNPGTDGPTGTFYLASQPLSVQVSIKGKYAESWVLVANDASIVTTSTAANIVAAVLANSDAMQALSTVDFAGGTGADVVSAAPSIATEPVAIAASVSAPPTVVPGRFYTSFDGDMLMFANTQSGTYIADYMAAPALPLAENEYPGT